VGLRRNIRHTHLRAMQSGLDKMKANIATLRGFGGGILSVSRGSLSRYLGRALGCPGEAAGADFSVALDAPSQSQASARRDRIRETLPRLNNVSDAAP